MKQKTLFTFMAVLALSSTFLMGMALGFYYGETAGYDHANFENQLKVEQAKADLRYELSDRWFDFIGNPSTENEQKLYDCIIYGDCD